MSFISQSRKQDMIQVYKKVLPLLAVELGLGYVGLFGGLTIAAAYVLLVAQLIVLGLIIVATRQYLSSSPSMRHMR